MSYKNLILILSGLIFIISFVCKSNLEIQLHDIYFIIAYKHIFIFFSLLMFIIWLIISIIKNGLKKK